MINIPENIVCGYFDCSEFAGLSVSPERKTEKYEIEFYLQDADYTFCDSKCFHIKKNHIQIAKPNQIRYTHLPFSTLFIKFNVTGEIAEQLNTANDYFEATHSNAISRLFGEIILMSEKAEDNGLQYFSKIFELLNLIIEDSKMKSIPANYSSYRLILSAKEYIKKNSSNGISLSDIAASVNLSPTYFHKIFTESVGCSPHDYLIQCRIDNTKQMLWYSDNEMCDIAISCGFGCQQYMNTVFKKYTGMTPKEYRKHFQKNYTL